MVTFKDGFPGNKSMLKLVNPFSTNVPFIDKSGSWILLANYLRNTYGRVTFYVKMQIIDLHLYLKCHSSTDVFQTFC